MPKRYSRQENRTTGDDMEEQNNPDVPTTKRLGVCGHSLVINVTLEAKALGLDRGDYVVVTIKRLEG